MNAFQQKIAKMDGATHKKMYRAGKLWLTAGITLLGMTEIALTQNVVRADTTATDAGSTAQVASTQTAHVTAQTAPLTSSSTTSSTAANDNTTAVNAESKTTTKTTTDAATNAGPKTTTKATTDTSTKPSISAADLLKQLPQGTTLKETSSQYVFDFPADTDAARMKAIVDGYTLDKGVQLNFKLADPTNTSGVAAISKQFSDFLLANPTSDLVSDKDTIALTAALDAAVKSDNANVNSSVVQTVSAMMSTLTSYDLSNPTSLGQARKFVTNILANINGVLADNYIKVPTSNPLDDEITNATTTASPYSQESDVAKALTAIKNLSSTATDTEKQAAIDALTAAVNAAKPLRDDANTAATTAAGTVTGDLANNPTVTVAQTALQDAVTAAANNTGSTGAITAATGVLNTAVKAANDANTALTTAKDSAIPYSQETDVKTVLDNTTLPANATTDQIQAAADNLAKAVDAAKTARDTAIAHATDEQKNVGSLDSDAITAAQTALATALSNAAAGTGTTAKITAATDNLTNAIQAAETLNNSIANAPTSAKPYSKETDVANALKEIADLGSDASTEDKQATVDKLTAAVAAAKTARDKANTDANTQIGKISPELLQNPTIAAAVTAVKTVQTNANNDEATTAAINTAIQDLTKAVDAANSADAAIANAATTASPYSQETDVANALTAITNLPTNATTEQKQDALTALNTAKEVAAKSRDDANNAATNAKNSVTTELANNPTVAEAATALQKAVDDAAGDQGTSAKITAAADKLTDAVAAATTADEAIKKAATTTSPYSQEPGVEQAL
ncbi:KxYKxGKxW signal peptide domain-containing protein, partial [Lacticaseibacillus nasuensis]|uniref:KxYKxGKxW signal peptide domain-containing protein n=1 Tax=Lacticaseibacillus nasuensis TaxID=944671 RepID=UPI002245DD2C